MRVFGCPFALARRFVAEHHRHSKPPIGHKFSLALLDDGGHLVAVTIIGRPVSRVLDARGYLEVLRLCAIVGVRNAGSQLLGAAAAEAQKRGYSRLVTYTLESESGASLRGAGWTQTGTVKPRQWSCPSRPREQREALQRIRWEHTT